MFYIKKYNLKKDYISAFNKLNKSNVKYSKIRFDFIVPEDINYLKDFNINFSHIKQLTINNNDKFKLVDYNLFLKTLFSFKNIEKNMINLKINFSHFFVTFCPEDMENLNNFKSLEILSLENFYFDTTFLLKL